MLSLAMAGLRSVQRMRLIKTSCFSRRSSSLNPRTHRSMRSLMMIRSTSIFMKMATSIDVDYVPGDEVTLDQKNDCVRNVLRIAVALQRNSVRAFLNIRFILARRRQDQPRSDGVDHDIRSKLQCQHG